MEDNQAAIIINANNPLTNKRTIHILQVRYHFVRQLINEGHICIEYCPTAKMLADILTKPLDPTQHNTLAKASMNA